jgi:polyphenol oxidase
MKQNGFILRESQAVSFYSCKAFETIPNLRHGFSTRKAGPDGHSLNLNYSSWDSDARVDENRRLFLSALNLENVKLATLHQVHSNRVYIIEDKHSKWNPSEGDALATAAENIALGVKTADCLPVLIADPATCAIAAVHSGWRGTLSGVLPQTIATMQQTFGSNSADLLVAVGPGIRQCCFEVGRDVTALFEKEYQCAHLITPLKNRPGKYLFDLCGVLDIQLDAAGVLPENRYDSGACTVCNPDLFYSYRAQGDASGRMMAVIGWRPSSVVDGKS